MLAKRKEKDVIDRLLDQIDFHGMTAEELAGENGLLKKLTSRFYSKILEAEMDEHLGYKKNDNAGDNSGNSRNGYTTKTVISDDNDTIEVHVPRDRNSTFEPVIIPKHEKRTPLFNDRIISMYSFGMSARDIQHHLQQARQDGLALAALVQFSCHVLSRVIFFASYAPEGTNPWVYSAVYNGSFLAPKIVISGVVTWILLRKLEEFYPAGKR